MIEWGRLQALLAVGLAGVAAWFTSATATRFATATAQFEVFGLILVVLALVVGSRFAVGAGVLVALAGAVIEIAIVADQRWGRAFIIACLWYGAAELAWDALERRDGRRRERSVDIARLREVGTVMMLSLTATVAGVTLAGSAPQRSLLVLVLTAAALALVLSRASALLATAGPTEPDG